MKVLLVFAHPEPRSLNGSLRDVAVHELSAQGHEVQINHGILHYPGFDVLPAFVAYKMDLLTAEGFEPVAAGLRDRMREFFTTAPIAYRRQNGGEAEY